MRQKIGLFLGPLWLVAALIIPAPDGLPHEGWTVAGSALFMVTWWISEAVPIPATSLLPLVLFPLFGGGTIEETASPFAHPLIFMFMGGLFIATAMVRWSLHKRIALAIIRRAGPSPRAMIMGFMVATAFLSMWISNTATAVMMLPVALSVISQLEESDQGPGLQRYIMVLLLCVAYAANIGGIGTLVGTPPNAFLAAFFESEFGYEVSFIRWMTVGVPVIVVGLPLTYFVLTHVVYHFELDRIGGSQEMIRKASAELGPMSRGERSVTIVFLMTALLWATRPLLTPFIPGLSDGTIAMIGAVLLFVIPVDLRRGIFVHSWEAANAMPWGTLILFGSGLSMAAAMSRSGLAEWIAVTLDFVELLPALLVIMVIATVIIFLTEMTSNTATTATFLPLMAALALGTGENPLLFAIPAVVGGSCAFMLPVATAPNAIIYGSERVSIPQMARAGLALNIVFIGVVSIIAYMVATWAFGIQVGQVPSWAQ